jgi:ABC-type sulfate transport system permease component
MSEDNLNNKQKWVVSVWVALLFLLIASPFMFKITNAITNTLGFQTSLDGCPNIWGLLLHTVVFAVLVRLMMLIPVPNF